MPERPTLERIPAAVAEFARSYCPPRGVDIAPATQAEAERALALIETRHSRKKVRPVLWIGAGLAAFVVSLLLGLAAVARGA